MRNNHHLSMPRPAPTPTRRAIPWIVLVLVLLAAAVRLAFCVQARDVAWYQEPGLGTDQEMYLSQARRIVVGQGLGRRVDANPLYPLVVLPMLYTVGCRQVLLTSALQAMLMGMASVLLLYLLAHRLCGPRTAVVAAFLAAIHPPFVVYDGSILSETLINVTALAALAAIARLAEHQDWKSLFVAGVALGLAALAKPAILVLALIVVLVLLIHRRGTLLEAVRRSAFVGVITCLTIAPMTVRNYLAVHEFIPIRSNDAQLFLMGNNPCASGHFVYLEPGTDWARREREAVEPVKHSPTAADAARRRLAWEFIRRNPGHFLRLTLRKLGLFFSSYEYGNNLSVTLFRQETFLGWPVFPGFGWLLGFAALAPFIARRRCRDAWILYVFIGLSALTTALFVVVSRYRLPATFAIIILTAAAAVRIVDWARAGRWGAALGATAAGLALVAASYHDQIYRFLLPVVQPDGFIEWRQRTSIVRDDWGLVRACFTRLDDPRMAVEKELIVPADLLPASRAAVFFPYRVGQESYIVVHFNGLPRAWRLAPNTEGYTSIEVPVNSVVPGRNMVRIQTLGRTHLAVWVNERFRFGRSRWRDQGGQWHARYLDDTTFIARAYEHRVGGEYLIRLALDHAPAPPSAK